jgi:lipopolysaccharide/colanic/teichoic acid biosynthesis glycosyltransferase
MDEAIVPVVAGGRAKRAFDVLFASAAILLCIPVVAVLAVLVMIETPGPAFYRRRMAGRNGVPFWQLKLRTMVADADQIIERDPEMMAQWLETHKLRDDPRVTRLGHFLRKHSLDELPQFWNVLVGEMSIIGPRPLSPTGVLAFGAAKDTILSVRPGLTGLWQVSGRQETTLARRIELDLWYIENASVRTDLRILWKTVGEVLRGNGAY